MLAIHHRSTAQFKSYLTFTEHSKVFKELSCALFSFILTATLCWVECVTSIPYVGNLLIHRRKREESKPVWVWIRKDSSEARTGLSAPQTTFWYARNPDLFCVIFNTYYHCLHTGINAPSLQRANPHSNLNSFSCFLHHVYQMKQHRTEQELFVSMLLKDKLLFTARWSPGSLTRERGRNWAS